MRPAPPTASARVSDRPRRRRLVAAAITALLTCAATAVGQETAGGYRVQLLPASTLFKEFVAGVKPARMSGELLAVDGGLTGDAAIDGSLGGRVGLVRFGQAGPDADGWQLDVAAAAFPRLNLSSSWDVDATDFRFGVPLSYRRGGTAVSVGYDHISTHVGDEFLTKHRDFERPNYSRDQLLAGVRQAIGPDWQVYGEAGYAFVRDGGAEPWVFQTGAEFFRDFGPNFGGPVAAANVQLREEFDWGGRFKTVAGWQWRNPTTGRLFRVAGTLDTGKSRYYEFGREDATAIGVGAFYDF